MMLNKNLQEINIQNMDTELVAQMFKNYQSNVLFHLEGKILTCCKEEAFADHKSNQWAERPSLVSSSFQGTNILDAIDTIGLGRLSKL